MLAMQPPQEWIQYGVVHKNAVQSLMRLMQGVFTPKVFSCQTGWPDTVKKDLTSQFHRFMASLVS
jgi:dynein heavy chain